MSDAIEQKPEDAPKHHAREFMSGSEFKTYDAIMGAAKFGENLRKENGQYKQGDPLMFSGRIGALAHKNGTCENTETNNVKKLVKEGWLIQTADQRHVRHRGNFTTNQYRVLTVEDWLATGHSSAPTEKRKQNRGFRKMNIRRLLVRHGVTFEGALADKLLDMVVDQPQPAVDIAVSPTVDTPVSSVEPTVDTPVYPAVDTPVSAAVDTAVSATVDTGCVHKSVDLPVSSCPPLLPEDRWREFVHKMAPMMGAPSTDEKRQLREIAEREPHGLAFLAGAVEFEFQNRPKGTTGLRSMWATFLRENEDVDYVRAARKRLMANGEWRLANIPGERERQDASIERQTAELIARRDANRVTDENWSAADLMEEN